MEVLLNQASLTVAAETKRTLQRRPEVVVESKWRSLSVLGKRKAELS